MADIRRQAQEAGEDALLDAARDLLEAARRDIPVGDPSVDPHPAVTLAASGYVRRIAPGVVEVGFATPYAAWQHENQHAKHPRGGKAKYLEDNLKALIPRLSTIVAGEVRAKVGAAATAGRRSVRGRAANRP